MLKYMILVVQNSLTTGILLAMLFGFVQLSGRPKQKPFLIGGLIVGMIAAFVLAVLKSTTILINREYFNIGILSAAILAEVLFYIFLWGGKSQNRWPVFHERAGSILSAVLITFLLLYCLPDIFLYPTDFLMSGESVFSTDFLFKTIGYLIGLLIVILSAVALYKVGTNLSCKPVCILLTIGLTVNMVNQFAAILQFLLGRRIIPMQKGLFEFIKMAINYNNSFLYSIMAVTSLLAILLWVKSKHPSEPFTNPAQHRKLRAASRRQRRWCAVVLTGYILAVLCLTVAKEYDEREIVLSPAEPMDIVGSEIMIPLENINDGHLHRFVYTTTNGTEVRFIIIKKNANSFGVGLDACDICGPTGYYERDDEVICKLCDVVMNKSTIGFKGGCNPVPLSYTLSGGKMVIQTQNLENEKSRFE
ncbi:Fe-S-containing protein [Clostridium aminobutyricum]|uniref:DUF2318 domain-containing protein n=1 Tax=Clostridium aminobutyricum TaxID=33953 RepID=A0A939IH67_CLOAM|nr:Fe-S-containing protein [Clostridium aminobutyricum]MBN7773247.1 DUF2318 domain-containing protein [Clostridium aminobutyricum]